MRAFVKGCGIVLGGGGVILLIVIAVLLSIGAVKLPQAGPGSGDRFSAWFGCKTELEKRLKAPSTAEFASYNDATIVKQSSGRWAVGSEVTAQNSFGVPLRQKWACEIAITGDRYTVSFLALDDQILVGK